MVKRAVCYMMSDPPHMPNLVVSLYTLRKKYNGEVVVYAFPQSMDFVNQVAKDSRLDIIPVLWEPSYPGKNCQPIERIIMMNTPGYDVRLYLDADTSVHGPLDELFELGETHGMAFTQFNHWLCSQPIIRRRLEELRSFPTLNQELLEKVIGNKDYPSVNCGVYCCRPGHVCLPKWIQYTIDARSIFIADERVQHIIMLEYWDDMIVTHGKFNASHKYYKGPDPAIVLHYHGDANCRPDKSPLATRHWWHLYDQCQEQNIGFVNEWKGQIKNKWMDGMKREMEKAL